MCGHVGREQTSYEVAQQTNPFAGLHEMNPCASPQQTLSCEAAPYRTHLTVRTLPSAPYRTHLTGRNSLAAPYRTVPGSVLDYFGWSTVDQNPKPETLDRPPLSHLPVFPRT
eukprot:363567-Chlamydomonas_euryale.AAC.4